MKKWSALMGLLAVLVFSIEAFASGKTHESHSAKALSLVDEPQGCFVAHQKPCAVMATDAGVKLQLGANKVELSKSSGLVWMEDGGLRLLQGSLWVEKGEKLEILSALIKVHVDGEAFVQMNTNSNQLVVYNLNGKVQVGQSSLNHNQELPVGFKNWYQGMRSDGQWSTGVMQVISLSTFAVEWNRVAQWSAHSLRAKLLSWSTLWKEAHVEAAQFYSEVIERKIAQHESEREEAQKRSSARRAESRRFKDMLLERAFQR